MRTIQGELGQEDSIEEEVEGWLAQLEKLNLEEKTHDKIEKEIKRMLRAAAGFRRRFRAAQLYRVRPGASVEYSDEGCHRSEKRRKRFWTKITTGWKR